MTEAISPNCILLVLFKVHLSILLTFLFRELQAMSIIIIPYALPCPYIKQAYINYKYKLI